MNRSVKEEDGTIQIKGLVYIPLSMIKEIIKLHHDRPMEGHFGIEKTCEKIT
jgi:hypothetical protein